MYFIESALNQLLKQFLIRGCLDFLSPFPLNKQSPVYELSLKVIRSTFLIIHCRRCASCPELELRACELLLQRDN